MRLGTSLYKLAAYEKYDARSSYGIVMMTLAVHKTALNAFVVASKFGCQHSHTCKPPWIRLAKLEAR